MPRTDKKGIEIIFIRFCTDNEVYKSTYNCSFRYVN